MSLALRTRHQIRPGWMNVLQSFPLLVVVPDLKVKVLISVVLLSKSYIVKIFWRKVLVMSHGDCLAAILASPFKDVTQCSCA